MNENDFTHLLEPAIKIAEQAGEKILEIYATEFNVDIKQDKSPLTEADLASHTCIVEALNALEPSIPIISEESSDLPFAERKKWETYWLIDPLDGTKEFIKRNGEFTVNIALIHQHKAVLGVVYVPVKKQIYYAGVGQGSHKKELNHSTQTVRVRQNTPDKITVVGSRSHQTPELADYLANLGEHDLISMGSSLKLCLVAEAKADLYPRIGLTSEWDTAAAQCVVEQAGGRVTDLTGEPLLYNTKKSYLNPYFLVFGDNRRDWTKYVKK